MRHAIPTPDGRTLSVYDWGTPNDAAKPTIVVHMGTPGSGLLFPPNLADAQARGIRLISHDRPGYGESTPHPDRTVADVAADVRTICEALSIKRIGTWGLSGGGPHALACAALLPDLVAAAVSLGGVAPYDAEGLDWFAGMGQDNIDEMGQLIDDPAAARRGVDALRDELVTATPDEIAASMATLLSPVDRTALDGDVGVYMAASNREGLRHSGEGWWEDDIAMVQLWGFDPADITVPTRIVHGAHDLFVPISHGQWLAARIPGAEAHLLADDGHLTLLTSRIPETHEWLASHL